MAHGSRDACADERAATAVRACGPGLLAADAAHAQGGARERGRGPLAAAAAAAHAGAGKVSILCLDCYVSRGDLASDLKLFRLCLLVAPQHTAL
jgi:hypothetical protein